MPKTDSQLLSDLKEEILGFRHAWDRSDNEADYECRFCSARPRTNDGDIQHSDDCQGLEYYKLLTRMEEKLDREAEAIGPG